MHIENEIKVLDIDIPAMRKQLRGLGFSEKPQQAFRRYVYLSTHNDAWLRLRTDGVKTTLTYKYFEKDSIDGMHELEVEVSDFEDTHELLLKIGMQISGYQENRRQRYTLPDIEVSIDEWPLIPAYMEIEATDSKDVEKYLTLLNGTNNKTTSEPTSWVYSLYGHRLNTFKRLAFDD